MKLNTRKGTLFLTSIILLHLALIKCPYGLVDAIDFQDLVVDGWNLDTILEGSYGEFVEFWGDQGVATSDYLMGEAEPQVTYLLIYSQAESSSTVGVEINVFDSEEEAHAEFSFQRQWKTDAPMFKRFLYGTRIFQEGNVLLFFFSNENAEDIRVSYGMHGQTTITLVDSFIAGFYEKFSPYLHGVPEAPTSSYTGRCVWGIRPGDAVTWQWGRESFTGSLGTGTSHTEESLSFTLEVVEFSEDNAQVLVKERHDSFKVFDEHGSSIILDFPYYSYSWVAATDGLSRRIGDGPEQTVIYPLYRDGDTLIDFLLEEVSRLPEKSLTEGGSSLSIHGRTSSASGFTPLQTEWRDITVQSGTGIVSSYEFYYNDNEYSITTTSTLILLDTNIDTGSREPYLISLAVSVQLSSSSVTKGEKLVVSVHVEDEESSPVEGVSATAAIGDNLVQLADVGGGDYQGQLETSDIREGEYEVVVAVEGGGYESAEDAVSLTVKSAGISGFPIMSVALGILIGAILLFRRATAFKTPRPPI
jgi:hypothetical protein